MGKYKHDMKDEKSGRPAKFPDGWRDFRIMSVVEAVSKAGNDQFVITIRDLETGSDMVCYAVAVPKKRWFLKTFLAALCIPASEDGIYEWDISDVLDLNISGRIENEPNNWIDTNGVERKDTQSKVVEWRQSEVLNTTPETFGDQDKAPF